ncbi:hypothetical protein R1sor_001073 [Riccia sorocarpa]|uniref:3-oxo-5-alpha-steroid 4-dehydrogenase C-terminal domain-containing protein n=1 Tax=Riccia sorocarpa TaxID=122646 RepID=A0ABD3GZ45_9MARC
MELRQLLDMQIVQRWLFIIWAAFAGPVILTLIPLKLFDPLRRFYYAICRRGKLLRTSDSARRGLQAGVLHNFGVILRLTVPQSFFVHFYIAGLLLNTILLFTAFGFACKCSGGVRDQFSSVVAQLTGAGVEHIPFAGDSVPVLGKYGREAWRLVFLLLLFQIHLVRRLYECIFVSKFNPAARMNLLGYIIAIGFYVNAPLILFSQAFGEEGISKAFTAYLTQKLKQGGDEWMESTQKAPDILDLVSYLGRIGWWPYLGAAISLFGAYHQFICHDILAGLREDESPGSSEKYHLPTGDWFELVSCPHYFAEIIIYIGFLVASGGTSPLMYLLLGLVVANLYLVAKPTHEWYLAKFDDYPKSRRAMIPYIC